MKGLIILYFIQQNNIENILVHKSMATIKENNSFVNIVLSPEFFTFIRESYKIKFKYQAKQIAPSIFDDLLEEGVEYQYSAYKKNDEWNFFAYNLTEILTFLKGKGINTEKIKKIFFIQEINDYFLTGKKINASHILLNLDNIITILPTNIISDEDNYEQLDIKNTIFKNGELVQLFSLDGLSNIHTIILSTIFFIFGVIFITENNVSNSIISHSHSALEKIENDNEILVSKIARDSIHSKYTTIEKKEKKKRQILKDVSKIIPKKINLKKLVMDRAKIVVDLNLYNNREIKKTKRKSKKFKFNFKKINKNSIRIEKKI